MLKIRQENENDYDEVYNVIKGSEKYYPKFGYIPAINYAIKPPFDVSSENFMAVKLSDSVKDINGIVEYAREFGV